MPPDQMQPSAKTDDQAPVASVGLLQRVRRGLRNRARRLIFDTAHLVLALELRIIQGIGFDPVLAWANRQRSRLVRSVVFTGLSKTITGVDRVAEMRLAWKARWHNRDFAVAVVVAALNSQHKNAATLWWAARPVPRAVTRNLLDEIAIEALTRMNAFDRVEAFASSDRIDPLLRARARAEIALRSGDEAGFLDRLAEMGTVGSEKRRPYLRWLLRFVDRDATPAQLLPEGSVDQVLKTSELVQGRGDHAALEQVFHPRLQLQTGIASWTEYRSAMLAAVRALDWEHAARLALRPVAPSSIERGTARDVSLITTRIDALGAVGQRDEALEVALGGLKDLARSGEHGAALRLAAQSVRRFPDEPQLLGAAGSAFQRISLHEGVATMARWRDRYCGPRPAPLVTRERCFIVANGPSIAEMPLGLLAGEDIFVVNRGMQAQALGLPPPRFLVVSDNSVYRDYWREIDAAQVEALFLTGGCLVVRPRTDLPHLRPVGTTSQQWSLGGLTPSPRLLHVGGTVVLVAIQLALFMGYREINVMGVDLSYDGPTTHFYGADAKGKERLFTFRTGDNGVRWVNAAFGELNRFVAGQGASLRNVGVGGNLHALPRLSLENALQPGPALASRAILA